MKILVVNQINYRNKKNNQTKGFQPNRSVSFAMTLERMLGGAQGKLVIPTKMRAELGIEKESTIYLRTLGQKVILSLQNLGGDARKVDTNGAIGAKDIFAKVGIAPGDAIVLEDDLANKQIIINRKLA